MCSLSPKGKRYSNGTLTFFSLLLLVCVLILSVLSFASYGSGLHFYEAAINWYREVIIDVVTVDPKTGTCTGDQQDVFDYDFKGLEKGCDCSQTGGKVTPGSCSASQSTCQNVNQIKETTMKNWVKSGNPMRLCFKRLPNYKYYQKYLKSNSCRDPSNEKMCGGSNPLFAYCVPIGSQCPVQSISTSQINPSDTQIGGTGLWIQRNIADQGHLSEANVGDTGICYFSQYKYIFDSTLKYPLLSEDKYMTCVIDSKYQIIDTQPASNFFDANMLTSSSFPGLTTGKSLKLFGRKYIEWKMACRSGNEFEDLIDVAINFATDEGNHSKMFKLAIANVCVIGVYAIFLLLGCFTTKSSRKCCSFQNCCQTDLCCCCCLKNGCSFSGCCTFRSPSCIRRRWIRKEYNRNCWDCIYLVDPLHLIWIIVKFGVDIAMVGMALMNVLKVRSYAGTMADLAKKNCSDTMVNESLQSTSNNISNIVSPLDIVITIFMVIYLALSIIAIWTYMRSQVSARQLVIKQKMDANNLRVLPEQDQTIPSVSSSSDLNKYQNQQKQVEIQGIPPNQYHNDSSFPINNHQNQAFPPTQFPPNPYGQQQVVTFPINNPQNQQYPPINLYGQPQMMNPSQQYGIQPGYGQQGPSQQQYGIQPGYGQQGFTQQKMF